MRYHCPVYFVLSYHKTPTPISTRHIWLYDRGDYQSFARDLHETNWELSKDNDIDAYAKNIIDQITALAKQHIQNKTTKIRQSDLPRLTCEIKKTKENANVYTKNTRKQNDPLTSKNTNILETLQQLKSVKGNKCN